MKNKIVALLGAAMFLALPMTALAKINGVCSDCHTMHNSKAGAPMAKLSDGTVSNTPFPVLLLSDCEGCHASGGAEAIATWGGSEIPQVYHTDTTDLAGGNFAYIDGTKGVASDRNGHNVVDILSADATLTGPPGMGRGATVTSVHTGTAAVPNSSFTCAGNDGCHGVRNRVVALNIDGNGTSGAKIQGLAAMTGSHHYNVDGQIDAATGAGVLDPAKSYRFLNGLYGTEDADWQYTADAGDHNDYFGKSGSPFGAGCADCHDPVEHASAPNAYMTTPSHSISGFCSTCHGSFHLDTNTAGSFVRHPTDYALPNKTEYAAYQVYDLSAPVARTNLTITDNSVVTPGAVTDPDVVMCLSCHVAHGSANAGMLRFDYADMVAGGGAETTGCFACHTTKDTGTL